MKNKKVIILRFVSFAAALAVMIWVFLMSAQDAATSSGASGGFIRSIAPILKRNFSSLSIAEQDSFVAGMQHTVRKLAHFSIYTLLGLLLSMGVFTYNKPRAPLKTAISFGVGVLYAISDEIHQLFVPGRGGQLKDVLLDSCGVLLGTLFVLFVYSFYKKRACRE